MDSNLFGISKFAELHVHFEGCLWEKHVQKYSDDNTYLFPKLSKKDRVNFKSFDEFLAALRSGYNYLNGIEQYVSVFEDFLVYMSKNNIVYSELQINLALINTFNLNLRYLLTELNKVLTLKNDSVVRFIIDLPWQFSSSSFKNILDNHETFKELGVIALSMGGDEAYARPKEIAQVYKHARNYGFKLLCHAGETTSYNFSKAIVQELKPDRIAHGLSISNWLLNDHSQRRVIDTCLTSNIKLGLIKNIKEHPFGKWIQSKNIIATLSTDDPAIFDTTLAHENNLAASSFDNIHHYYDNYYTNIIEAAFDKDTLQSLLYN